MKLDKNLSWSFLYVVAETGGTLFGIFPVELSLLLSSMVFIGMGCIALVFSLALHKRSRSLAKLPKDISANIFNKTFNVLHVGLEHRNIISSHTGLVIFIALYGSWFAVTCLLVKIFESGGVLGAVTLLICAGLLMIDETQELHKNAGLFAKAVEGGTALGKGDVQALNFVRGAVSKLSQYHLVLAVAFFASSIGVPYIVDGSLVASAEIAQAVLTMSTSLKAVPFIALLLVAGLFATAIVLVEIAINRVRKRIFGFPLPIPVDIESRQSDRMKMYVRSYHNVTLREPKPEDTEKANRKDIEEHGDA
jgi:hypothetical protein